MSDRGGAAHAAHRPGAHEPAADPCAEEQRRSRGGAPDPAPNDERDTAKRPLLGSVPVVSSRAEAERLEAGQDDNEYLDTSTMLLVLPDRVIRVKPKVED